MEATGGELRGDDRADRSRHSEQSKRSHLEPRVAGGRIRQYRLAAGHHQQDDRLRPGIHPQRPNRLLLAILVGWLVPPRRGLARPGPSSCCCWLVQRTPSHRRRGRTTAGRLLQRLFGLGQATVEQHDLAGHRRHPWKLASGLEHEPSPLLPLDKALHGQRAARIPGKARPDRRSGQRTEGSGTGGAVTRLDLEITLRGHLPPRRSSGPDRQPARPPPSQRSSSVDRWGRVNLRSGVLPCCSPGRARLLHHRLTRLGTRTH